MCDVVAIHKTELSDELISKHRLQNRVRSRLKENEELWFFERERYALLPVWHHGQLLIYPWGSKNKQLKLPLSGSLRQEQLDAGDLAWLQPEPVDILATFASSNGFWYDVPKAIRGLAVKDVRGNYHAYMLLSASTHYFRTMTRSDVEPVFVGKQI